MKKIALLSIVLFLANWTFAQELNVQVTVNTPKLQTVEAKVFENFQNAVQEFMNNQRWTDVEYEQGEKIKINLQITVDEEVSATSFKGEFLLQAVRPVYNSSYETVLFTHRDPDIEFSYQEYQPLDYNENSFSNNLTSLLAFYAYITIGMDYDSFVPFGGTPYFQKAQEILNNASGGGKGWVSLDANNNRNRYFLIENILSPKTKDYREAMYNYHRQGLDVMSSDSNTGRAFMATALESLQGVDRNYPNSMILQVFSNSKRAEIIDVFRVASTDEKNKIVQVMSKIDRAKASEYQAIRKRG